MQKGKTQIDLIEEDDVTKTSGNRSFEDVLAARISWRNALAGSLAAAATTFFGASHVALAAKGRREGARRADGSVKIA